MIRIRVIKVHLIRGISPPIPKKYTITVKNQCEVWRKFGFYGILFYDDLSFWLY